MFLARKAYGQDLVKHEAAVLKRIELGLASPSLQRTFDDLVLLPGVTLSAINAELVKCESRDEPGKYQQCVVQEQDKENAKKPSNPPAATLAKELALELVVQQEGTEGQVNLLPTVAPTGSSAPPGGASVAFAVEQRGRNQRKPLGEVECWNCGQKGHYRTSCPQASEEEKIEWKALILQRARNAQPGPRSGHRIGGKGCGE